MKKIMFLVYFFTMVIGLSAQTAIMPAGCGTEENPYQIATWQNLYWISVQGTIDGLTQADRWSKNYIQTTDITFPMAIITWNNHTGWSPIGFYNSESDYLAFTGTYNGDNKTITGLCINRSLVNFQGFFGITNTEAEIKNIGLININVIGNTGTGGLVGWNYSPVTNCYSTGSVTGNNDSGGLVGYNYSAITNCYSAGSITGNEGIGGLVGENDSGIITNCYSTRSVTGYNDTGGLVGKNDSGTITNCYSIGSVTGNNDIGGLVGWVHFSTIKNCFWDIQTSGISTSAGGIGKTTAEMHNQSTYANPGWNFSFPWKIESNSYPILKTFEELNIIGFGSETTPYEIANSTQLVWLSCDPSVWKKHFKQTADITLPEEINTWDNYTGWFPIKNFRGTYDGDNKTITGLFINRPYKNFQGLFGHTYKNSEIKNIVLINTSITGHQHTGELVGMNEGIITNCYSSGSVTGEDFNGGLVGRNCSIITNCYNSGNVTGINYSGGLVGMNEGTITYCYSTCNVTGEEYTGGLVGYNSVATITNCYSTCNVTGEEYTGGLVGYNLRQITNCYSNGSVIGDYYTGGLVGYNLGQITSSFWDTEISGQALSSGGTGKTTAEMKDITTYTEAGWSFPEIWDIDSELNNGYPYLNYPINVANDDLVISQTEDSKALLKNAYPNPFNPSTTLSFVLTSPEIVRIDIYNVKGQLVKSLVKGSYNTGNHSIVWDGKDNKGYSSCSGVYLYKMQAGKHSQTKKMMLMK